MNQEPKYIVGHSLLQAVVSYITEQPTTAAVKEPMQLVMALQALDQYEPEADAADRKANEITDKLAAEVAADSKKKNGKAARKN